MADKSKEDSLGCLLMLFAMPFSIAVRGWCVQWLWLWFIAEPFAIPVLTFAHATGLSILIGYLCKNAKIDSEQTDAMKAVAFSFFYPLLTIGAGYVVHRFM